MGFLRALRPINVYGIFTFNLTSLNIPYKSNHITHFSSPGQTVSRVRTPSHKLARTVSSRIFHSLRTHTVPAHHLTVRAFASYSSRLIDVDDSFEDKAGRMEESLASRAGGSRRPKGSGNRGRGGGGGGGGGNAPNRDVLISKALSALLRHQAANAGIELDGEGFAPLDKVLQWNRLRSLKATFEDVKAGVADNAKQRFSMKPNPAASNSSEDSADPADWLIRANQGHSIKVANEGLHTPITLEAGNIPETVVHGTYFAFWPQIEASGGLRKMGRTHVHFGTGLPDGGGGKAQVHDEADENSAPRVISGMRSDAEVLVFVDVEKSLRQDPDTKWWLSENGVVLSEGNADGVVPTKYFKEVRGRRQGVGELWKDGQKVADLPDGVVARVPQGKRGQGASGSGGRGGRGGGGGGKRVGR